MVGQACVFCGKSVIGKPEVFVKNRVWGLQRQTKLHECGHQSVFEEDESPYSTFFVKQSDPAAQLVAKYGFSKWKGKVVFHYEKTGLESHNYFKKLLSQLLKDIDKLLASNVPDKEEKAKLLIENKFEPYKEVMRQTTEEFKAKKKWAAWKGAV